MKSLVAAFKEPVGVIYHGAALSYAILAYCVAVAGLLADSWAVNLAATILLGHGMTIAAYLIHECAHNTIFRNNDTNTRFGVLLTWLTGSCYGTYEDIRYKHFRHHIDNRDPVWFDYQGFFNRHPALLKLVKCLEWLYIPAHDLLMHGIMAVTSFVIPHRRDQRRRNIAVLVIRVGLFLGLAYLSPIAAVLYTVAYMIMMQTLRFMDLVQHDYMPTFGLFSDEPAPHKGDKQYEQAHTFSNPISLKYKWVNWLTLNFGFHNAHHTRPTAPWYQLPALHHELFGDNPNAVIPLASQLKIFHTRRVGRIMHDGAPTVVGGDYLNAAQHGQVFGGNAVSFLTAF